MGETAEPPADRLLFDAMNPYQQHIRNASDVCSSCFGRLRREAVRPRTYASDEMYSERLRWRTSVEDVPDEAVSEAGTLFCDCGADGAHTRIWDDKEVDRDQFRDLLTAVIKVGAQLSLIRTRLEAKAVASTAWRWFDTGASVDRIFKEAFATLPPARGREATPTPAHA